MKEWFKTFYAENKKIIIINIVAIVTVVLIVLAIIIL